MSQTRFPLGLSCDKTFFELMRRIEAAFASQHVAASRQRRMPNGLRLIQPAALHFSPTEITDVRVERASADPKSPWHVSVQHRNFGLFAPYGPLPIHVTEHAWIEKKFERSEAFEQFINLLSSNMAWLHYRAWSAMHPAVGFDRARHPFVARLAGLVQAELAPSHAPSASAQACRLANPGVYLSPQRPLAALQRVLSQHFEIDVKVRPRRGRWFSVAPHKEASNPLGRWRLGSRVWDVQQTIDIELGPVEAEAFPLWQRRSARVQAVHAVALDYTQARTDSAIHIWVKTRPELAAKLGGMHLGVNAWMKPGHALKRLTVHASL